MYHAINDRRSVISISTNTFAWQMRWLHEHNFQILSLNEIITYLKNGKSLPSRSLAITFDDGFECVYNNAFPILKKYQFPATIFLVAGYCGLENDWPGQPPSIPKLRISDWPQIKEMDCSGIEFGSHTNDHLRLDRIPLDQVTDQIVKSKLVIEEHLNHSISLLAYPYGRFNKNIIKNVKSVYQGACTAKLNLIGANSDPYKLDRIDVYYVNNRYLFTNLWGSFMLIYLSLRRNLHSLNTFLFQRTWG
jgi:peptidoglycan/xylan/chitin deacetylase (PgdA/CDA1 family)